MQPARGIAKSFQVGDSHHVEHTEQQIGHRCVAAGIDVLSAAETPTRATGEDNGQLVVRMSVTVRDARAVNNHRVVKQAVAVDVFGFLHSVQEVTELLQVPAINLCK